VWEVKRKIHTFLRRRMASVIQRRPVWVDDCSWISCNLCNTNISSEVILWTQFAEGRCPSLGNYWTTECLKVCYSTFRCQRSTSDRFTCVGCISSIAAYGQTDVLRQLHWSGARDGCTIQLVVSWSIYQGAFEVITQDWWGRLSDSVFERRR
jgi:hypothetical protein